MNMKKHERIENIHKMSLETLRNFAYLALEIVDINEDGFVHIKKSRGAQEAAQRIAYMGYGPKTIGLDGKYYEDRA